ncbi:hypothetical protein [Streptomyces sp. NPDC002845]
MAAFTRKPVHDGYDELGSENTPGEDYWILADGRNIGTTWYCSADYARDGERWASDGPAGFSMGHRTREDAEQAQADAYLADPSVVIDLTPEAAPAQSDLAPLPMTYEQALAEAERRVQVQRPGPDGGALRRAPADPRRRRRPATRVGGSAEEGADLEGTAAPVPHRRDRGVRAHVALTPPRIDLAKTRDTSDAPGRDPVN